MKLNLHQKAVIMYTIFLILSTIMFLVFSNILHSNLARETARNLAHFRSEEISIAFQNFTNESLNFLHVLSFSEHIPNFLNDPESEELAYYALQDINRAFLMHPNISSVILATEDRIAFEFFSYFTQFEEVRRYITYGTLSGTDIFWTDYTRDSEAVVTMNFDDMRLGQPLEEINFFINREVTLDGIFVGASAINFPVSLLLDEVFSHRDDYETRSFLIDSRRKLRYDNFQMDVIPVPAFMDLIENTPSILELFVQSENYFSKGVFGANFEFETTTAFEHSDFDFEYASIAAIPNTPYIILTLSSAQGLISFGGYYVMFGLYIVLLMVIIVFLGQYFNKIFVKPIFSIADDIVRFDQADIASISGSGRMDEIGYLARTIQSGIENIQKYNQEKTQLLELEERNKIRSQFFRTVSHEIRTPITTILAISEVELRKSKIEQDDSPSDRYNKDVFLKIRHAANMLLTLVNSILDASKIEAGKMTLFPHEYETYAFISQVSHLSSGYLLEKEIKFRLELSKNIPKVLIGDNQLINQITINVLSNAFKYTEQGQVCLAVDFVSGNLVIKVTDSGVGMSQDQVASIFEDFVRFEDGKKQIVGTGMGMGIVLSHLELMSGVINIQSEPGKGTTVRLTIPQKIVSDGFLSEKQLFNLSCFALEEHSEENVEYTPMPYGQVLVVDDVASNLHLAISLLAPYEMNVTTCKSGEEALTKIQNGNTYDLILMDMYMEGMNGTHVLEKIRELGYKKPVILCSNDYEVDGSLFDETILKPIQQNQLNMLLYKYVYREWERKEGEARDKDGILKVAIGEFLDCAVDAVARIEELLRNNQLKEAHYLAHKIAGLSDLMKEPKLAEVVRAVEKEIRNNRIPLLDHFEAEMAGVLDRLTIKGYYQK